MIILSQNKSSSWVAEKMDAIKLKGKKVVVFYAQTEREIIGKYRNQYRAMQVFNELLEHINNELDYEMPRE